MGLFWFSVGQKIRSAGYAVSNFSRAAKEIGSDIKDSIGDFKDNDIPELKELFVDNMVDLAKEGVELSTDYLSEKKDIVVDKVLDNLSNRADRFFENWDAILADDPYIDGKKASYEVAASNFEKLYKEQKKQNDKLLSFIKSNSNDFEFTKNYVQAMIFTKKTELTKLKQLRDEKCREASEISNCTMAEITGIINNNTNCRNLFDILSNRKLRELKKGQLDGYIEAKKLFETRLEQMKQQFNNSINALISAHMEEIELYNEIYEDINKTEQEIIGIDAIMVQMVK